VLPHITIITPSLNGARYLGQALESLAAQSYPDLEHVLIDAGSTDDTVHIAARSPTTTVIQEADRGAHDAMNKGIARADGDIIGFLNTDDLYAKRLLLEVGEMFAADADLDVVVGGSVVFNEAVDGMRTTIVARDHAMELGGWLPELTFGAPGLNGRFFRRRVFDRVGRFDVDYFYGGDREFLIRLALAGLKSRVLARPAIYYRAHTRSFTFNAAQRNAASFALENLRMARAFLQNGGLREEQRRLFLAWHAFEILRLMLRGSAHLPARTLWSALRSAWRFDMLWPLRLPAAFAHRSRVFAAEQRSAQPLN
jgi:glycosyltransferase involved in cell wall biosynthesis